MEVVLLTSTLYVFGAIGCESNKKVADSSSTSTEMVQEEVTEVNEKEFTYGKVTTAYESDGCNYLIQLKEPIGEDIKFLLPIGLDEEFLTNGMMLKFTYTLSRAPSGNCYIGTPAVLANVTSR